MNKFNRFHKIFKIKYYLFLFKILQVFYSNTLFSLFLYQKAVKNLRKKEKSFGLSEKEY